MGGQAARIIRIDRNGAFDLNLSAAV